jgi:hypothetical protein
MTGNRQRLSSGAMDRSTRPSFNFVNLQHPDDLKNEETQLRIRRLAMTEVGKARRKPRTKRARHEIVLEFRDQAEGRVEIDRFGGGQLDPFGPYPVELDDSERALLANGRCVFRDNQVCFSNSEQFSPPKTTIIPPFCEALGIPLGSVTSLPSTTCLPILKTFCSRSVMVISLLRMTLSR